MDYYNEIDPHCAAWLRNLMDADLIPRGHVDERSIVDVKAGDLDGYVQCHFFAGLGGWPLALQLASYPADRAIWTGSCPCPPFSSAGKRLACPSCHGRNLVWCPRRTGFAICADCRHAWFADGRHLWPEFWRLIAERRPGRVIGEQVASEQGLVWLAGVRGSLEILGYVAGGTDLPACGVGAPHIRQRLFWVADRKGVRCGQGNTNGGGSGEGAGASHERLRSSERGEPRGVADADGGQSGDGDLQRGGEQRLQPEDRGVGRLGDAGREG